MCWNLSSGVNSELCPLGRLRTAISHQLLFVLFHGFRYLLKSRRGETFLVPPEWLVVSPAQVKVSLIPIQCTLAVAFHLLGLGYPLGWASSDFWTDRIETSWNGWLGFLENVVCFHGDRYMCWASSVRSVSFCPLKDVVQMLPFPISYTLFDPIPCKMNIC
jgi:hypothetical protein